MTKLEKVIQAQILDYLLQREQRIGDVFFWRQNTAAARMPSGAWVKFGRVGCPDILGVQLCAMVKRATDYMPLGQAFGIEVKQAGADLSDDQRTFKADWERHGGLYVLARSTQDAIAALGAEHIPPARLLELEHRPR